MKYVYLKDFPPTGWKKGDIYDDVQDKYIPAEDLAIRLAVGIIEPVEEKKGWVPEDGEYYYYLNSTMKAESTVYASISASDEGRREYGNCFPTKEAALAAAEKIKEVLQGIKKEA